MNDAISKKALAYWVAFAKTGKPEPEGLPKWETQNPKTDFILNFTNNGIVTGPDPIKDRLDLIAKLAEAQANAATK